MQVSVIMSSRVANNLTQRLPHPKISMMVRVRPREGGSTIAPYPSGYCKKTAQKTVTSLGACRVMRSPALSWTSSFLAYVPGYPSFMKTDFVGRCLGLRDVDGMR